ncbi:MAG: hypothetical protein P1U69_05630 [Parvibaculaceae bacterium]|nr:hypothetical protein [Parvibaculaceae bacterium]HBM88569.1 hypothetical protein [Rhodobiaceae bacterium]|tara:strand:+ start:4695 stop:5192 length:498 start_codon:yes stop_codon:yes gene_type:complete
MRTLLRSSIFAAGVVFLTGPVMAAGNVIAFKNDSCVAIHLEAEGNDACFGYGGCQIQVAPYQTKHVELRPGVRPKWAQINVTGSCEEKQLTLVGQCAVDLEQVFRGSGYMPGRALGEGTGDLTPAFEEVVGPFDPGVSFATVRLSVGLCEEMDGHDRCDVRCDVD